MEKNKEFIDKAKKIHGNKYDYSKVVYKNNYTKVCIICPEHGEFWQTPNNHLKGYGCSKCSGNCKKNNNDFITKAKNIHGDKYEYSKINYINSRTKICIICPEHGEFWQTPNSHLSGCGCPECKKNFHKTKEIFVLLSKQIHGEKYDYSKVEYINNSTKVCIICPEHGEFWQTPNSHLSGNGCPKCAIETIALKRRKNIDDFINQSKTLFKQKYDYSNIEYVNNKTKINVVCPIHGEFFITPTNHLQGKGCPKCSHIISEAENKIFEFIKLLVYTEQRVRDIIPPYELDIYIPYKKIAIEYNGLLWHSERYNKDKKYHLNKTLECERQGIRLIHIFEDEYIFHKEIVLSKIKQFLGQNGQLEKISARKTIVKEITKIDAESFLNKNHLQGFVTSTVYFGCFNKTDNELVAVMTFKRERNDCNRWELTRFATDISKHCIGVGGKLFSNFVKVYNPSYVKSFADRRWTLDKDNNLYTKLGFKLDKILKPDYRYVVKNERIHKFNFRKDKILRHYPNNGLTSDMTEKEMTDKLGFYRIWDCGLFKYVWKKTMLINDC